MKRRFSGNLGLVVESTESRLLNHFAGKNGIGWKLHKEMDKTVV
ncbi:MAG: hypothetical protein ACM3X9_13380 [Bacillota bacterium]